MANLKFLEAFAKQEAELKEAIENPSPKPKYNLWDIVEVQIGEEFYQGRICGFQFVRVAILFRDQRFPAPGWYYHVETAKFIDSVQDFMIVRVVEQSKEGKSNA